MQNTVSPLCVCVCVCVRAVEYDSVMCECVAMGAQYTLTVVVMSAGWGEHPLLELRRKVIQKTGLGM